MKRGDTVWTREGYGPQIGTGTVEWCGRDQNGEDRCLVRWDDHRFGLQLVREAALEKTSRPELRVEDLEIRTFDRGGVTLIHRPTGLRVSRRTERSQLKNKALALQALRANLALLAQLGAKPDT